METEEVANICIYLDNVIHNRYNNKAAEVEAWKLENMSIKFNYILKNNVNGTW